MRSERLAKIKELLYEATQLPEGERKAFLDRSCRDDPTLRREIDALLHYEGSPPGFLKTRDAAGVTTEAIPDPSAMIGRAISHYRIREWIGAGGMGVVYKAEDTNLLRPAALKFLPENTVASQEARARFEYEARAAAGLDHPNICTIYEFDEAEGLSFIAMAFIDGETLQRRISRGPLEIEDAVDLGIQVAEALQAAHEKGIVHRDIKPGNIMITPEGRAKVMDFGLAHSSGRTRITRTGVAMGTVVYMSPEQARGQEVDQRTDIWSLGVILYEMLTARLPFKADNDQAVIYGILNEEPDSVRDSRDHVPPGLERIIAKAMAKKPDDRYQTAAELADDLKLVREGRAPQRRWLPRIAAGLSALLLLVAGVFLIPRILESLRRGLDLDPNKTAVAIFQNRTGDNLLDPIGEMISGWIMQGISQMGMADVVPTAVVLQGSQVVGGEPGGAQDTVQLRRLGRETGAAVVVSGVYFLKADSLQFHGWITDVETAKPIYSLEPVVTSIDDPTDQLEAWRQRIMGGLALAMDPWRSPTPGTTPPLFDAVREANIGKALLTDPPLARQHYERAWEIDSTFSTLWGGIATSYRFEGRYAQEESIYLAMDRRRDQLVPYERYELDAGVALLRGKYAEAMSIMRQMAAMNPKNNQIVQDMGVVALFLNRPREALECFQRLQIPEHTHVQGPVDRWWLKHVAQAHHMLGEYDKELEHARMFRKRYPDSWAGMECEVRARCALGQIEEVEKILEESFTIPGETSAVSMMDRAMKELRAHGYREKSLEIANRIITWCESQPGDQYRRSYLYWAYPFAGRWQEFDEIVREAAAENPESWISIGNLGWIAAREGDREGAEKAIDELVRLDDPYLLGKNFWIAGKIAALLGDKERAVQLLRQGLSKGFRQGIGDHRDIFLEPLRGYPAFDELMRSKG